MYISNSFNFDFGFKAIPDSQAKLNKLRPKEIRSKGKEGKRAAHSSLQAAKAKQ